MTTLSNEDKLGIVDQHIKNVEYSKYNLELSIIEENAVATPNAEAIASLNTQIAQVNAKLQALATEKASLTAQEYKMAEKAELVITALQQRIGEIVSNYETQIAILRAEITQLLNEKKEKDAAVQKYEEHIDSLSN